MSDFIEKQRVGGVERNKTKIILPKSCGYNSDMEKGVLPVLYSKVHK